MYDRFCIHFGNDPHCHIDFTGEIEYDGEFCILVSQDEGFESLDVEIYPREDGQPWRFKIKELEWALNRARQRLWELRRRPDKERQTEE